MTGTPQAIASSTTRPSGSSQSEGTTSADDRTSTSRTAAGGRKPWKVTFAGGVGPEPIEQRALADDLEGDGSTEGCRGFDEGIDALLGHETTDEGETVGIGGDRGRVEDALVDRTAQNRGVDRLEHLAQLKGHELADGEDLVGPDHRRLQPADVALIALEQLAVGA